MLQLWCLKFLGTQKPTDSNWQGVGHKKDANVAQLHGVSLRHCDQITSRMYFCWFFGILTSASAGEAQFTVILLHILKLGQYVFAVWCMDWALSRDFFDHCMSALEFLWLQSKMDVSRCSSGVSTNWSYAKQSKDPWSCNSDWTKYCKYFINFECIIPL